MEFMGYTIFIERKASRGVWFRHVTGANMRCTNIGRVEEHYANNMKTRIAKPVRKYFLLVR